MSWRSRDERGSRWETSKWEGRDRSPVWEPRHGSPERRSPHRHRHERRPRHERDHRRDRHDRDRERDRDRDRERDRKRYEDAPSPPSPPIISDERRSPISRSESREKTIDMDIDKDHLDDSQSSASPGDWVCQCGLYNFKRRQVCYRRNCNGKRSDGVVCPEGERNGMVETAGITKKLLFRRLDALTTEEKILEELKNRCSKEVLDSIAGISVGRESLTGASKCLAYISFNSIADSTAAHTELLNLQPPLWIDNREVLISFYNEAKKLSKTNHVDYSSYYTQMPTYTSATTQAMSEADRVNAAAAVAQSAISAAQARQISWTPVTTAFTSAAPVPATSIPTGDGKTVYPAPDVRTFLYDESSGFYYDPSTCLYYDGKTQYFYNSQISQYLYWDAKTCTYTAISQAQNAEQHKQKEGKEPDDRKRRDKEDKVKVAKKIAKDMERWARTLNQKKENARSNIVMEQPTDTSASKGSADIGFSVLGAGPALTHVRELSPPPTTDEFLVKKITEPVFDNDDDIIDWSKLTCLLCKRKFPSVEVLNKHKTMSDLHKQNLAEFRKKNDLVPQMNGYRDRAAERRLKFGEDDAPIIRKRYEPPEPMGPPINPHPPPNVVDTIGGKMLQKMGWSEGRGLGKTEQGRIAPIEAEQRPSLAGLGQKRGIYTPTPGETYRDTVKKLMIARYKEVVGQEDGK